MQYIFCDVGSMFVDDETVWWDGNYALGLRDQHCGRANVPFPTPSIQWGYLRSLALFVECTVTCLYFLRAAFFLWTTNALMFVVLWVSLSLNAQSHVAFWICFWNAKTADEYVSSITNAMTLWMCADDMLGCRSCCRFGCCSITAP